MSKNHFKSRKKVGDYELFCDICAMRFWASEAYILPSETGRGGLVVCPVDRDKIDYGLIPYTVGPDESPSLTRSNHYADNPENVPTPLHLIDITIIDPMLIDDPSTYITVLETWENLGDQTWEKWALPWGSVYPIVPDSAPSITTGKTWENLGDLTWDNWDLKWGT